MILRLCTSAALAALLAGCSLGPEPIRPQSMAQTAESFTNADSDPTAEPQVDKWWQQFDDPITNELVAEALKGNTDLRAAAARLMQAQSLLGAAIGRRFPEVGASIGRDRSQRSFEFGGGRFQALTSTYSMQLDVNWQVDLFGRLRRGQQQAGFELLATQADREAVLHSVIASVVRARAQLATIQRQRAIAKANTASFQSTYQIIQRRYEQGVTTALDLRLAGENLAASKAREPQIERSLRTTQHALDVLLGRQPGKFTPPADTLSELPEFAAPPVGVPLGLLDRRPDLQSAEFRAAAQQAGIGIALADLFPDITIGASIGYQASSFDDMFDPKALVWSLITQAATKVWQGGALRANVDASRAAAEASAIDYTPTMLNAMREVEDAIVSEKLLREVHEHLTTRLTEARQAERLARQRYERGVATILDVLETERRRRLAEEERVLTQNQIWETRIALYLSLGGDWGVAPGPLTDPQFIKPSKIKDPPEADPAQEQSS